MLLLCKVKRSLAASRMVHPSSGWRSAGIGNDLAAAQGPPSSRRVLLLVRLLSGCMADGGDRIPHTLGVAVGMAVGVAVLLQAG